MKIFVYFLILFIFLLPLKSYSEVTNNKEIELTQKQIEFVEEFKDYDGYKKVEWVSPLTLEITYDVTKFYFLTKERAKKLAVMRATYGYAYIQKDICVRILVSTKTDPLAYECVGKDIPTES